MPTYYKLSSNTYFGGKGSEGTYQKIINQIPPHDIRVIGFAGHCAITRHMKPAGINFLIDKSHGVIEDWRNAEKVDNTPGAIIPICDDFRNWIDGDTMEYVSKLDTLSDNNEVFVYLDPPYPLGSRKCDKHIYEHEMTDKDHSDLLHLLDGVNYSVAISTYPNKIYRKMLSSWRKIEFQSSTRHGMATEWLFMNYPEPTELHDYSYLGNDFRQREQIKKKQKSLISKISQLTPLEKAMLQKKLM